MLKKRQIVLLFISFFVLILFVSITFIFEIHGIGIGSCVLWVGFFWDAFSFKKIILENNSLTFDAFARKETYLFSDFVNANLEIITTAGVYIKGKVIFVYINLKTKDGLIKIIQLSEKISQKSHYINMIEKRVNIFKK